jgi:hypothetical protein
VEKKEHQHSKVVVRGLDNLHGEKHRAKIQNILEKNSKDLREQGVPERLIQLLQK